MTSFTSYLQISKHNFRTTFEAIYNWLNSLKDFSLKNADKIVDRVFLWYFIRGTSVEFHNFQEEVCLIT